MPQVIPLAAGYIASAAGASTLVASAITIAATVVVGSYQSSRAKQKARDQFNASQVDRLANVVTAVAPRELVLGRVRKGGHVSFRGSTGSNKSTFVMVLSIAGHEIDGVEQVYFNDQPVTLDASGFVLTAPYYRTRRETAVAYIYPGQTSVVLPHTPVSGSISGAFTVVGNTVSIQFPADDIYPVHYQYEAATSFACVRWDLGAGTAVADARTSAFFPDLWTSSHRGQGIAKLFVEFFYDETAFPAGVPVVSALVRGAKVYDPRSGLTVWSDNPALLARHVYQHASFGKATVSAAEDTRFSAAANACSTSQNWVVKGQTTTAALYRAGLVAPYGTPARSLLDDLTEAMAGMWAFAGGELFIRAGVYMASVKSFTDSDLAVVQRQGESEQQEQLSIAVHRERAQKFNVVNPRIWDAGQDYKQVALSPVRGAPLITRDGAELAQEVTLAAVSFAPQAQHVCGVILRDARDPLTVEAPFKMTAWPVEIFDTVSWTSARYGWSNKTFTVVGRRWDRAKGVVYLTLKETAAAIYTPDAAFLPNGYAQNTSTPSPWDIEPPGSLAAASGTEELVVSPSGGILTRVRVTWAPIGDSSITQGGEVEAQWSYAAETLEWHTVRVPGSATEVFLTGPADGALILIRARTRNALATSDWSIQLSHQVVGQTARPAAVAGFSIAASNGFALASWTLHTALDVVYGGEIVIRHTPLTSGAAWEDGYILDAFDGRMVSGILPLITGTYMAKAKDRTGNWSQLVATFVATEGMVTGFTTVSTSTQDPAFSGSKTSLVVDGIKLKLDSLTLVDAMTDSVDSWSYIDAIGGLSSTGTYLFTTHLDLTTVAVRRFEVDLKVQAYDAADLIDARTEDVDTWDAVDGDEVNTCDVTVYAATTNDNPAGAPVWGAWTPFMVADFNCRAAKFKAEVTSGFPTHNINIEQLRVAVKVPA